MVINMENTTSNSFSNKFYKQVVNNFPDADPGTLQHVIKELNNNNHKKVTEIIVKIIKEIFKELEHSDLNELMTLLGSSDYELLDKEISQIISEMDGASEMDKDDIIRLIIRSLQRKFLKYVEEQIGIEQSREDDLVPKHVKIALKEDLKRAFIYEFYKFVSPHQLAGETALENFMNNVIYRGIKYAINYEGKEFVADKSVMNHLSKIVNVKAGGFGLGK